MVFLHVFMTAAVFQQTWCICKVSCSCLGMVLSYSTNNRHFKIRTFIFVYLKQLNHSPIVMFASCGLYPISSMVPQ